MNSSTHNTTTRVTFPIAVKLGLFALGLLSIATVPIFFETSKVFEKASTQREKQYNRNSAISLADKAERLIWQYVDKTKLLGGILLESNVLGYAEFQKLNKLSLEGSREVLAVELWQKYESANGNARFQKVNHIINGGKRIFQPPRGISKRQISKLIPKYQHLLSLTKEVRSQGIFDMESTFSGEIDIKNVSFFKEHLALLVATPVRKNAAKKITHIAIAYVAPDRLIKAVQSDDENRKLFLVDSEGKILVDAEIDRMVNPEDLSTTHVLVKNALDSIDGEAQAVYKNYKTGEDENLIGDYARNSLGVLAISQVPESVIFKPIAKAKRFSIWFTGVIFCLAFFMIFAFSITLTDPIEKLFKLTEMVAKGDFTVRARQHVKSFDEVGQLALAFDNMTQGLAERQKMESVLNKFHGSDIADKLIKSNLELGGERKDVIVFFSDIRNFTKFSESKDPEEVVEVLNEYFDIIVKVIDRNRGVVDKFIGDSVMGVWGLDEHEDIAERAIRACLELRIAFNRLNHRRKQKNLTPIHTGIGLHSGSVIAGTIGSEDRMEYTVIGDAVNTASRIEAATKSLGVDILISDSVLEKAQRKFVSEKVTDVRLPGKQDAISLYKVTGYINERGEAVNVENEFPAAKPKMAG